MKKIILLFIIIPIYSQQNLSVVSLDRMNVVYRGLSNPISIAVPNCKNFTVTGTSLYKNIDGTYQILPGSGIETEIKIEILLNDNSTKIEYHKFRISNLKTITTAVDDRTCKECILEFSKEGLKDAIISAHSDLDIYGLTHPEINFFQIEFPDGELITNYGNKFNDKVLVKIDSLAINSIFVIKNLNYKRELDIDCGHFISPIKIMIIDSK